MFILLFQWTNSQIQLFEMAVFILLLLYCAPLVTPLSFFPLSKLWPLLENQSHETDKQHPLMTDIIPPAVRNNVNNERMERQIKILDTESDLRAEDDRIPPFFNFLSGSKARYDDQGPPFYPNFRSLHDEENTIKKKEDINKKLIEKLLVSEAAEQKKKKKEAMVKRLREMLEKYAVNALRKTKSREVQLPDDGIWGR